MIRYGTSYFVSFLSAVKYYMPYVQGTGIAKQYIRKATRDDVKRKLSEGIIHIGKPPLSPGDRLEIIDNGTRYCIVRGE